MRKLIIVAAALGALTLFQNCSSAVYGSKADSLQQNSGGTGNGYDGKIFVVLSDLPCPDSTYIDTAILVKDPQQAYLLRESCQSISPRPLSPASFTMISPSQVVYNGTTYTEMPESQLPRPILPAEESKTFCTRKTTAAQDGFEGVIQIEIGALNDRRTALAGVSITLRPADGSWLRQVVPFPAEKSLENDGSTFTLFAQPPGGDVFKFAAQNGIAIGYYNFNNVADVLGDSGRKNTETWAGAPLFSCGVLPW